MTEKEIQDPQLQNFILAETQKQRFQVSIVHYYYPYCITSYCETLDWITPHVSKSMSRHRPLTKACIVLSN